MSYRGELPGFYWDGEKRKYFAIHANQHAVAPVQAKYTQSSVDQKKRDAKNRRREVQRENARRRVLIQRAPVLETPGINSIGITTELGHGRSGKLDIINDRSQAYLRGGLSRKVLFDTGESRSDRPSPAIGRTWCIPHFDYDAATQGVIFGLTVGDSQLITAVDGILPTRSFSTRGNGLNEDEDSAPQLKYSLGDSKRICVMQSQISSLHLNPTTRTLITTSPGDSQLPAVHITRLIDPAEAVSSGNLDGGILTQFRLTNISTIFCSAVNPWPNARETIVIGTGGPGGIRSFRATSEVEVVGTWNEEEGMTTGSDVLAMDWLSQNLLAAGLRDGMVALYDVRARQGVKRMRHAGGILNLKRADEDARFVCTGMGSKMALYDLRALREEDAVSTGPKRRRTGKSKATPQSIAQDRVAKPVLTFQYDNEYDMLGMDVCPELGVVAAAETGGRIRASSLRTGKSVALWNMHTEPGDRIGCVRFAEDAMGAPKLMASFGSKIVELSW